MLTAEWRPDENDNSYAAECVLWIGDVPFAYVYDRGERYADNRYESIYIDHITECSCTEFEDLSASVIAAAVSIEACAVDYVNRLGALLQIKPYDFAGDTDAVRL